MQVAWRVWLTIGVDSTKPPTTGLSADKNDVDIYIPSQAFLTALIQIFPALFQHIKIRFVFNCLHALFEYIFQYEFFILSINFQIQR